MTTFFINTKALTKFAIDLKTATPKVKSMISTTVRRLVMRIESIAKDEAPYKTGTLRRSIQGKMIDQFQGVINPSVNYAWWVHEGTNAHSIFPGGKKALYWDGARHPVKRVSHPGTKDNPFMERASRKGDREANKLLNDVGNKIISQLVK